MIAVLGLEEGGAFPYLRAPASPLVCSEIASLAPALHEEAALWALPSLPQTQTPRPTHRRLDAAMARLPGPFLCGALLGFVRLGGEAAAGGTAVTAGGQRAGLRAPGVGSVPRGRLGGPPGRDRGEGVEGRAGAGHSHASRREAGPPGRFNHHRAIVFLSLTNTPSYLAQSRSFNPQNPAEMCAPPSRKPPGSRREELRGGS